MKRMEVYFCACAVERGADAQNTKEGPEKEEIRRKEEREREAAKRQEAVSTGLHLVLCAPAGLLGLEVLSAFLYYPAGEDSG